MVIAIYQTRLPLQNPILLFFVPLCAEASQPNLRMVDYQNPLPPAYQVNEQQYCSELTGIRA
jgi:hypothetical protein